MRSRSTVFITACVALALIAITTAATAQTVTSIYPTAGMRGTTVHATVRGADFTAGTQVLVYGGGTAIWATNEATTDTTGIACDLAIPANAYLGAYTVYLQNPGSYSWVYSSTPLFTVTAGAQTPVQVSPADGAHFFHIPRAVTLAWQHVPGATGYALERQWYDGSGWNNYPVMHVTGELVCSYTFNFVGDQVGRWRVATEIGASTGPSSPWRTFDFQTGIKLATPTHISPVSGTVFDNWPRDTTLVWKPVPGAKGYRIEWSYQDTNSKNWFPMPSSPIVTSDPMASYYTGGHVGAQPGRWRVTALGDTALGYFDSDTSDWWTFNYLV